MRNGPHMTLIQDVLWKKKDGRYDIICREQRLRESGRESLVTQDNGNPMENFTNGKLHVVKYCERTPLYLFIGDDCC